VRFLLLGLRLLEAIVVVTNTCARMSTGGIRL
jgi:hypothetical protein